MIRAAVVTFPGSNCDRDLAVAHGGRLRQPVLRVWHQETELPQLDLIGVPGGFSYGDYLRCGAMAARSPVMREVVRRAEAGVAVLGVCNGFQILAEAGLLPGALIRNAGLRLRLPLRRARGRDARQRRSPAGYGDRPDPSAGGPPRRQLRDRRATGWQRLEDEDRIAFRYRDNPNGSTADIAGVLGPGRNVLGLMPHPERAIEPLLGGSDGRPLFRSLLEALA